MEYGDWYDFVKWYDNVNRGKSSEREIAIQAYEMFVEYRYAVDSHSTPVALKALVKDLFDSQSKQAEEWMVKIIRAVGNLDIAV